MRLLEKIQASITGAKILSVYDIWKRKPANLGFEDTDVLIVEAKAGKSKIKETFFICLKPDGTVSWKSLSKRSDVRRKKLADFLKHYKLAEDLKTYNLKEGIKKWIGRQIKVVKDKDSEFILIS